MPIRTDRSGLGHNIGDFPGGSNKARIINAALASGNFLWVEAAGSFTAIFECEWCHRFETSSGIQADHHVPQRANAPGDDALDDEARELLEEVHGLWDEAGGDSIENLLLSCSECNTGRRNRAARQTRGSYTTGAWKPDP